MARVGIVGAGAVGARLARQLLTTGVDSVAVRDPDAARARAVVDSLGDGAEHDDAEVDAPFDADVVVLAGPGGVHADHAARFLRQGHSVVSTSDDIDDVRALLALDAEARERGRTVVVGAGFAPGLTCVLAAHGAGRFDTLTEVHVAKVGTGGPACARQHHRALGRMALDWRDGGWVQRPGGSGRELSWFPDPVGAEDCYRGALPDALVIVPAFPGVQRVTARMAATRRDRLTARLPMLWPTHPEGGPGAVRVELRGLRGGATDVVVLGAMDRPAVAAGAVGAVAVQWILDQRVRRRGAAGLAELVDPLPFLAELARRGVKAAVFEGHAHRAA
ncbi:saccharopine dehydrogenase family protein [Rhabdothermincola salaria]|uniref:saccharopine dehydrogenase family protein n=1 Tax=Rhabdothermincola salaria TaxID=2903142 RepID=UPI001E444229|nr:Gfo/Idh/MocA family oxidoreductase [Rhabdothermincola salaria]MCD9624437.1 Gfo/Idh/MocA family oxidoreductase [Rhabdothermincola salaria]